MNQFILNFNDIKSRLSSKLLQIEQGNLLVEHLDEDNQKFWEFVLSSRLLEVYEDESKTTKLLEIVLKSSLKKASRPVFIAEILEVLFEIVSIDRTDFILDFLEAHMQELLQDFEPDRGKALVILRFCINMLKKLSKVQNLEICGRILIFLSLAFPICHRSAVNSKGEFNLENVTKYESGNTQVDNLYYDIWSIQSYFCNPTLLFEAVAFSDMCKKMDRALDCFEYVQKVQDQNLPDRKKRYWDMINTHNEFYYPKYLTNPNLFEMQKKDVFFRREILGQFLITYHFLAYCNQNAKVTYDPPKKNILTNELSDTQVEWLSGAQIRAWKLLEKISPQPKTFSRALTTAISHENNWCNWKSGGCKPYELALTKLPESVSFPIKSSLACNPKFLGNSDLSKLWGKCGNIEDDLIDNCKRAKKYHRPTEEIIEDMNCELGDDLENPLDGIEEEYLSCNQIHKCWLTYKLTMPSYREVLKNATFDGKQPGKTLLKAWRVFKKNGTKRENEEDSISPTAKKTKNK